MSVSSEMIPSKKKTIVASSDGVNTSGALVVTPASMILFVEEGDPRVFVSRVADDVCFLMNSLWSRQFSNVKCCFFAYRAYLRACAAGPSAD